MDVSLHGLIPPLTIQQFATMSGPTKSNVIPDDDFSHPLLVLRKLEDEDMVLEEWERRIAEEKAQLEAVAEALRRQMVVQQETLEAQQRVLAMQEDK